MASRNKDVCTVCGGSAPVVKTAGTLGSLGWRMEIGKRADGSTLVEWICPECWATRTGSAPLSNKDRQRG
jgi:hypothetical protein